jgi:TrmH RNA methyltransferase
LAQPRAISAFDPAEAAEWTRDGSLLLLLDGVSNPHNFGAIVRTAAFFGFPRTVLSDHPAQALPSDAIYRVAEGGLEYVRLYRASRFIQAIGKRRRSHLVVAAAAESGRPIATLQQAKRPIALVRATKKEGSSPRPCRPATRPSQFPGREWCNCST